MVSVIFARRLLLLLVGLCASALPAVAGEGATMELGPFGPQGPRMREQLWLLPSATPGLALRATVFRPDDRAPLPPGASGDGRPLVVINHGTSEATRHSVSMPVYYWLTRWFVERGYAVVLPQRRGHGATGGDLVEGQDTCARPDHYAAGQSAADDIESVVNYMAKQPFVAQGETVVVGISTGGWGSLALSTRDNRQIRAIVNFAGGRGGHAWGRPNQICDAEQLVAAAGRFGASSAVPTLWLYSSNDTFFGPPLARAMVSSYTAGGGQAELHVLPPYGRDGHALADDQEGWQLWGKQLASFLARPSPSVVAFKEGQGTSNGNEPARGSRATRIPVSLR